MDYIIEPRSSPPPEYPYEASPDEYSAKPVSNIFEHRRRAFFEFILRNPAPVSIKSPWHELARLAAGGPPHDGIFYAALEYIDDRRDCSDLPLHAILRMLFQYRHHLWISEDLLDLASKTLINFKYWPDEPGIDTMCTWTESHYLLFAAAGYLAGNLYPDQIFQNSGLMGIDLASLHRQRIIRWLNLRFFTGFSEWLSNIQFDQTFAGLLNLIDFSKDAEITARSTMIVDLLLYEMAINSFSGIFGSTHGRSDEPSAKWADQDSTTDTQKLLFGKGCFSSKDNMSAAAFALSTGYRMPSVLFDIANDSSRRELLHRQRTGIPIDQAVWWNLEPKGIENGMLLLGLEAHLHPITGKLFINMMDRLKWWNQPPFGPYKKKRWLLKILKTTGLLPSVSKHCIRDVSRTCREEANVYTYKTQDYMLSSAVDYRKGFGGDQQHIWQATLAPDAVCFTTNPARYQGAPPNYWTGNGSLPRVAQIKNVLIAIYKIEKFPSLILTDCLPLTHAWLPRDSFEEVVEENGWIFARYSTGYLALRSEHPYEWRELPGEDSHRELIVHNKRNIWICELGSESECGGFTNFIQGIVDAELKFWGSRIMYHSPSQGILEFGWDYPLLQDGREISLDNYPRYASPYTQTEFPSERIHIELAENYLDLDWMIPERKASNYIL